MWLIAIVFFHLILLTSTTFTLWPEMAVYPYLMNNGFLLYKDIINPYPPYLSLFLSFFTKTFGYLPISFEILTLLFIFTIDYLIYTFSRKIFQSKSAAIINTAFFALFSIPFGINGLWFDLIQTPFILISVYLLQWIRCCDFAAHADE